MIREDACIFVIIRSIDAEVQGAYTSTFVHTPMSFGLGVLWGISSSGRAPPLQGGGDRFESDMLHQISHHRLMARTQDFHSCNRSSTLRDVTICWCGLTVRQLTCNQLIVGSNPITSSIKT